MNSPFDRAPNAKFHVLAGQFYTEYCRRVGGKAFNGEPLPDWEAFRADPTKTVQSDAWVAVAAMSVANAIHRHTDVGRIIEASKAEGHDLSAMTFVRLLGHTQIEAAEHNFGAKVIRARLQAAKN